MKATILVIALALVSAVFATDASDPLLMKEASVHNIEVPKDDSFYLKFDISSALAATATGGPDLSIHITFRTTDIKRENHVYVGQNFTVMDPFIYSQDGDHTFSLLGFPNNNCTGGCSVYIKIIAKCESMSCINSISTRIWARLIHRSTQAYVYSNTQAPYMPLYTNKWSPDVTIEKTKYVYFEYVADAAGKLRVAKDSSIGSELLIVSGQDSIVAPVQDNNKWVQLEDANFEQFVAGKNYLGLYGGSTMSVVSTDGRLCVGECETDAASTFLPAVLLLVVSALVALF